MTGAKGNRSWRARLRAVVSFIQRLRIIDLIIGGVVGFLCWRLMLPYLNPSLECVRGKVAFWGDEGIVVHSADRIRRGEVLYRDFFNFQGPLGYLPFTLAFTFGPITATVGRGTMIFVMAVWCGVTYLTVKEITRKIWAGVLIGLYFPLCVWPTWPYAYEHFIAAFWMTCAVLFAVYGERGNLRRGWLVAGIFGAMSFWTSIPEGFCGIVSLALCSLVIRYATKARWNLLGQFAVGFSGLSGAICLYFAARGGLLAMLRAVFVFPFTNYVEKNKTEYAFDAADYLRLWSMRGKSEGAAVELMLDMTKTVPKAAIVIAVVVAVVVLERVAHRRYTRRVKGGRIWEVLAPVALAASLGALAVPVWWGVTRNDVCHLGFIQQTSVIALAAAFWFPISDERLAKLRWRFVWVAQVTTGCAVAAVLLQVHAFADANAKIADKITELEKRDLDAYIGRQMKVKSVMARLRPDELFVENYGGYTHLLSQRGDAISFPHLGNEAYYEGQFPIAAREIVTKRPRAILMSAEAFNLFVRHEPSIQQLYVGFENNYFLAAVHPGPPLHLDVPFALSVYGPGGQVRRATVKFERGGGSTPYVAHISDRPQSVFTYVDGDRVQIIDGNAVYVLELAADGNSMRGTYFEGLDITRYTDLERAGDQSKR